MLVGHPHLKLDDSMRIPKLECHGAIYPEPMEDAPRPGRG